MVIVTYTMAVATFIMAIALYKVTVAFILAMTVVTFMYSNITYNDRYIYKYSDSIYTQ